MAGPQHAGVAGYHKRRTASPKAILRKWLPGRISGMRSRGAVAPRCLGILAYVHRRDDSECVRMVRGTAEVLKRMFSSLKHVAQARRSSAWLPLCGGAARELGGALWRHRLSDRLACSGSLRLL
jgi:hypothetical protein